MVIRHVERHFIEISNWPEMLENRRARLSLLRRRNLPTDSNQFVGFADLGQMLLALFSLLERDAPEMFAAARIYAHGQVGVIELATVPPGQPVELPWEERRAVVKGTGPTSSAYASAWVDGWYASLMARDSECLGFLSAVPDAVLRASSTQTDDYHYAWKAALSALRIDPKESIRCAEEAIRLTAPTSLRFAGSEIAAVDASIFRILPALARGDEALFQEALEKALLAHRGFYAESDPAGRDHLGFVAWGPLALACKARDAGMSIAVESGYLLPPLIHHESAAED